MKSGQTGIVAVLVQVRADGSLLNPDPKIVRSSNRDALDAAAVAALRASAPFPHFPSGFEGATIELRIAFFYNIPLKKPDPILVRGKSDAGGIADSALKQLSISIDSFAKRSLKILEEKISQEGIELGPFCARVLLENSCAALVGRLDTFRILYLSEFQAQPQYEYGKRAKSAFSWVGDVIPEERPSQELWSIDHDMSKISRALFSRHLDHVCWRPAVERMLDYVSSTSSAPALNELFSLNSDTYVNASKGQSLQLYSTLSETCRPSYLF